MNHLVKKAVSLVTMAALLVTISGGLTTNAATVSVAYKKYVCSTNTISDYTLTLNENSTASAQSRAIIGADNRQKDGNDGIVKIMSGDEFKGTGFIVDDHTIATAAHVICDSSLSSSQYIAPALHVVMTDTDGDITETEYSVTEVHLPKYYYDRRTQSNIRSIVEYDYALLTVNEDLSGYTHFDLGISYNMDSDAYSAIPLFVTGVDDVTPENDDDDAYIVYTSSGTPNIRFMSSSEVITFNCDTLDGQSGSPIYIATRYYLNNNQSSSAIVYTALGIVSGGMTNFYNWGTMLNSPKVQFFRNNPYVGS